jgi:hypothetical protein
MRLCKVAPWALIVGASSLMSVSLARAVSDCSTSGTLKQFPPDLNLRDSQTVSDDGDSVH